LPFADIGGIKKNWILYQSIVDKWQTIIETRMAELDEERQNVLDITKQWEVTKNNADTLYQSKKIYNIIDTVFFEASIVDSIIKNRESFVFALFSQTSEFTLKVAEILEKIELAEEDASIRLFTKDEAAVWEKSFLGSSQMPDKLVVNQWSRYLLAGSFQTISLFRFLLQLVFLILLIILFKSQKKKLHISKGTEKGEYTDEITAFLFSRPNAVAFSIILILSFLFSSNYLPFLNIELAIPALRILPAIKGKRYFRQLYLFLFVYMYYLISELSLKSFLFERLNLIIIPLIMIIILILPLKSFISIKKSQTLKDRLLTYTYLVPIILFLIIFLTNLLGYFYLSQLFNTATLNSIFTGIILFIAVLIIEKTFLPIFKNKSTESIKILRRAIKIWEGRWGNLIKLAAVIVWIVSVLSEFGVYKFAADWITEAIEYK
jgi:hypothetical protein